MERRRITVFDKSKEFQKIEQNKCNEMIINDILNPLLQIIYALRESDNFNNIPGTDVGKKQAGTITQANLIIFTEPLTATYFFQNINTEKFTKQYREFTHTQESFQVLTACRTFSNEVMVFCSFEFPEESNLFFLPGLWHRLRHMFYNIPFKLKWEKRVRVVGVIVYSTITLPGFHGILNTGR